MKKLIALLLVAILCLGTLAGCGGGKDDKTTAAGNEGGSQASGLEDPLHDWILEEDTSISGKVRWGMPFKGNQGMDDLIAEFNQTYPNIEVELITFDNSANGNIALNTAITSGEYDVVVSFGLANMMTRAETGLYKDLTDKIKEEQIDLVANWGTDSYTVDGKYYTLPCGGLTHYVAINMDAWKAAGYNELPTEWTWDEYIEASRKMTVKNDDGTTKTYGGSNYQNIADMLNIVYQMNGQNRYYNTDGTSVFDSKVVKDQMQKYINAENEGIWFKLSTYRADNDKAWFTITDGRVNSTIICNLARYLRNTEEYGMDSLVGFAPYPIVAEGQENLGAGVNYFSYAGMTMNCQDEKAAWAFLKWYSSYGCKYLPLAGHQPTWKGTDANEMMNLIFGSEEEAAKIIDVESFKRVVGNTELHAAGDYITKGYAELESIWSEWVMKAFNGEMGVEEALTEAGKLANQVINENK
ncbi:MAG: extracellular solute-binding protein [Lachnospiraceae bacterium]|nr:extracellular solute-binding protein [Lachnospiraceae bacterium]